MTSPEPTTSVTRPQRRTFYVADLKCYMCGSVAGSLEREHALNQSTAPGLPVLLVVLKGAQPTPVLEHTSIGWIAT